MKDVLRKAKHALFGTKEDEAAPNLWQRADALLRGSDRKPIDRSARKEPNKPLEDVSDKHQPTKRHHDYLRWYDLHFAPLRQSAKNVLEIGLQTENSIKMWEEYFPNATVHGIDISEHCKKFEDGRRRVHIGDQLDQAFLASVVEEAGGSFDIIIDDGLHAPEATMVSFACLFPSLSRGGVYAVEDVINQAETLAYFSNLAHKINYWPEGHPGSKWRTMPTFADQDWITQNAVGVSIYRYLVFVTRGANPEDNPYLLSEGEFRALKDKLGIEANEVIDAMLAEGLEPTPIEISKRMGNIGFGTINEELERRMLN